MIGDRIIIRILFVKRLTLTGALEISLFSRESQLISFAKRDCLCLAISSSTFFHDIKICSHKVTPPALPSCPVALKLGLTYATVKNVQHEEEATSNQKHPRLNFGRSFFQRKGFSELFFNLLGSETWIENDVVSLFTQIVLNGNKRIFLIYVSTRLA